MKKSNNSYRIFSLSVLVIGAVFLLSVGTIQIAKTNLRINKVQSPLESSDKQNSNEGMFGVPSAGNVVYRFVESLFPE